jgi:PhnB protein
MATKKTTNVPPVPEGHRSLAPYLYVRGATRAMDFYARAFGARELFHMRGPDDRIVHAELQIGDSVLMLADENPEQGAKGPEAYGGRPASVFLYLPDVDVVFERAAAAGAKVEQPPTDMFWGDRYGKLKDPFGHVRGIATHVEDVSPEETQKRMAAMAS